MKKITPLKQCSVAMAVVINIVGSFIALNLKLPIYLDTIGTIFIAALLGPVYGCVTGIISAVTSGILFDIYSLYYGPVQIVIGLMAGILYKKSLLKGKKLIMGTALLTLPATIVGSVITVFLFGGITSSGSSLLIVLLTKLGANPVFSAVVVQIITDYIDKLAAVGVVTMVLAALPLDLKSKIVGA